jgi:hypothetical protein
MTRELAETIKKCLEMDEEEVEIYENYSGKGMYGRGTTALTGSITISAILSSVIEHADQFIEDGDTLFCGEVLNQDQFGLGYVIY